MNAIETAELHEPETIAAGKAHEERRKAAIEWQRKQERYADLKDHAETAQRQGLPPEVQRLRSAKAAVALHEAAPEKSDPQQLAEAKRYLSDPAHADERKRAEKHEMVESPDLINGYKRVGASYRDEQGQTAFRDRGSRIRIEAKDAAAMDGAFKLAKAKGWKHVDVSNLADREVRADAWIHAQRNGFEAISGHQPTAEDRSRLAAYERTGKLSLSEAQHAARLEQAWDKQTEMLDAMVARAAATKAHPEIPQHLKSPAPSAPTPTPMPERPPVPREAQTQSAAKTGGVLPDFTNYPSPTEAAAQAERAPIRLPDYDNHRVPRYSSKDEYYRSDRFREAAQPEAQISAAEKTRVAGHLRALANEMGLPPAVLRVRAAKAVVAEERAAPGTHPAVQVRHAQDLLASPKSSQMREEAERWENLPKEQREADRRANLGLTPPAASAQAKPATERDAEAARPAAPATNPVFERLMARQAAQPETAPDPAAVTRMDALAAKKHEAEKTVSRQHDQDLTR